MPTHTFKLRQDMNRPVINISQKMGKDLWAMVDTGAEMSVLVKPLQLLQIHKYKTTEIMDITFSGFGGKVDGKLYVIQDFKVGCLFFKEFFCCLTE